MAKAMGKEEAVDLLDVNLKQEKEALREVEKIATRLSNESAKEPQPPNDRHARVARPCTNGGGCGPIARRAFVDDPVDPLRWPGRRDAARCGRSSAQSGPARRP
jgi:hypothetical protein